jgi:hypothetical protein
VKAVGDRTIVFVDSASAAWRAATVCPGACLVSDNPLLAHDARVGVVIDDISRHLDQAEATRLGYAAVDTLLAIDRRLEQAGAGERYGGPPGRLNVTMPLRPLLGALMQRGLMLSRALAEHGPGPLVLMAVDVPRWEPDHPWSLPRFASPHRPLAERGFFGNRETRFEPVATELPQAVNDTAVDDKWLRAALAPPAMLVFESARRLGLDRLGWRNGIAVGKPAETLREALPWLMARGFRLSRFKVPPYAGEPAPEFGHPPATDSWLAENCSPLLADGIAGTGVFSSAEAIAIIAILLDHMGAGLRSLAPTRPALEAALDRAFAHDGARKTLLTSGYYGPLAKQLHALCATRGIALVDVEHGATTGLALASERRLTVTEATTSDILIVSSPAAARSFARARAECRPRIETVGLADQTRHVLRRPLQRWRARRRLGLAPGEVAVMHVSTLLYGGNVRPGDDSPVESFVFATERRLLTAVYGRIGKTVLFKPYPAQRFPHHAEYDDLFDLPANVRVIEWADFRYVRAAADIIVTNAHSSTIGWCVGASVPLVHLGSRMVHALIDDDLRARFGDAFFAIDIDQGDWADRLVDLLSRDVRAIKTAWNAKAPARQALVRDAIAGPPGSVGRRTAALVARLHG